MTLVRRWAYVSLPDGMLIYRIVSYRSGVQESKLQTKNFLKIHPRSLKVQLHTASQVSTTALFCLMITAWKPVFIKSLDMLQLLIIIRLHRAVLYVVRSCGLLLLFTDSVAWSVGLSQY